MKNFWYVSLASLMITTVVTVGCAKKEEECQQNCPPPSVINPQNPNQPIPNNPYPPTGPGATGLLLPGETGFVPGVPLSQQCIQRGGYAYFSSGVEVCEKVYTSPGSSYYGTNSRLGILQEGVGFPGIYYQHSSGYAASAFVLVDIMTRQPLMVHPYDKISIRGVSGSYQFIGHSKIQATDPNFGAAALVQGSSPIQLGNGLDFRVQTIGKLYIGYRDPIIPSGFRFLLNPSLKIQSILVSRCSDINNQIYPCR